MLRIVKIILAILAIPLGGYVVWYGEIDDSPGAMLIGFLLALFGVIYVVKMFRKDTPPLNHR